MAFKNRKNSRSQSNNTAVTTTTTFMPSGLFRALLSFILLCAMGGIGYLILLNVQPWVDVAEKAAKAVKILPFQDTLVAIPFLGGLILWCIVNASKLLAVALWGIVNGLENLPFFLDTAFAKKIPKEIIQDLNLYRAVAYVVEAIVCWIQYPTYQGGWPAVVMDWPNYDMNLIDWNQVGTFLLALGGCEICVQVGIRLWAIRRALNSAKTETTTAA
jgi:hypothetical protein